jgi:hypothetical protein
MELRDMLSLIHYQDNQQWLPLPGWAKFFWALGESLASTKFENRRFTVALALPIRSYAAAFIGAGFSYANLLLDSYGDAEYIEFIYSLPEGTSVKFFENGKVKKAIKKELHEYNGILHVGIQIENGTTKYFHPANVRKIEVTDKTYNHLPNSQKGYSVIPPSELLNSLLQEKSSEYVYRTKVDGVVVGSRNTLKEEALLSLSVLPKEGKEGFLQGKLQDLFRVVGFNPPNTGHRFLLQTSNSYDYDNEVIPRDSFKPDSVVIFDGALGFAKSREMYKNKNWVVILDHTEANFLNAIAQINQEYLYRSDSTMRVLLPELPNGMEMMFFVRSV